LGRNWLYIGRSAHLAANFDRIYRGFQGRLEMQRGCRCQLSTSDPFVFQ
jgi:hypothetical protein